MSDISSLIINFKTPQNKETNKTITYINPEAQPSDLKNMAQSLISFTNNTYEGATRIDKTDVDTAEDKQTMSPTFRWRHSSGDTNYETITSTEFDIDGSKLSNQKRISVQLLPPEDNRSIPVVTPQSTVANTAWTLYGNFSLGWMVAIPDDASSSTFHIEIPESDKYYAWEQTYTLTVVTPDTLQGGDDNG